MGTASIHEGVRRMRFSSLLDRQERGEITQEEAAEMLGVHVRTFQRWVARYEDEITTCVQAMCLPVVYTVRWRQQRSVDRWISLNSFYASCVRADGAIARHGGRNRAWRTLPLWRSCRIFSCAWWQRSPPLSVFGIALDCFTA